MSTLDHKSKMFFQGSVCALGMNRANELAISFSAQSVDGWLCRPYVGIVTYNVSYDILGLIIRDGLDSIRRTGRCWLNYPVLNTACQKSGHWWEIRHYVNCFSKVNIHVSVREFYIKAAINSNKHRWYSLRIQTNCSGCHVRDIHTQISHTRLET